MKNDRGDVKIAHLTSSLGPESAGLGAAVAAISAASAQSGYDVRVFGLAHPETPSFDEGDWSGAPATISAATRWSGPVGYAPDMMPSLLDFDADIVHLHGLWSYPAIAVRRWHERTGRPYVVSAHGMLFVESLGYRRWRKRVARWLYQDHVLRRAAILHATSAQEELAYRASGFLNCTSLIPLSVPYRALPERNHRGSVRRLLFMGRLHHQKGLDWLIEAWMRLEHAYPDWELSVVGSPDPDYAFELKRLMALAAGHRVRFTGPLYGELKDRYLADADLFVMPSRSENFGLVAAESLMMAVPVIATQGTPWAGLTTTNAGWWIPPGSPSLELALREAMSMSPAHLYAKGQNGRRWVLREFSTSSVTASWGKLYQRCLASAARFEK